MPLCAVRDPVLVAPVHRHFFPGPPILSAERVPEAVDNLRGMPVHPRSWNVEALYERSARTAAKNLQTIRDHMDNDQNRTQILHAGELLLLSSQLPPEQHTACAAASTAPASVDPVLADDLAWAIKVSSVTHEVYLAELDHSRRTSSERSYVSRLPVCKLGWVNYSPTFLHLRDDGKLSPLLASLTISNSQNRRQDGRM